MATKTKVKVTVKTGRKGDAGTLVARIPVTVVRNAQPAGKPIYQTKAQLHARYTYGTGQFCSSSLLTRATWRTSRKPWSGRTLRILLLEKCERMSLPSV